MTSIVIKDTGWLTSERQGTQKTGSDITNLSTYRVNGGNAITLKISDIRMKGGANVADEPNPTSNEPANVHYVIFSNDLYEIDYKLNVTDNSQAALVKELNVLYKTKGIKLLYADTTTDTIKTQIELVGRTDTKFHKNEVDEGIPVIVGRVRGLSINQISTSKTYQISGKITFEEGKVIT